MCKQSDFHISFFHIADVWEDFTVVSKLIKKMRVNINRFGWNCLKTLETFVWISNHVSRSTTWSPFNLKLDQNDQSKYDVSCGGVILTPSSSQHNFELAYNVLTKLSYCPSFQFFWQCFFQFPISAQYFWIVICLW